MTKKKSHSKSSTKGSSTNPQPTLKSALFQGSTPIQNVKKANQSAPKLPTPPEVRQASINIDRTASQQDFPTLPSKPDKAKSFSSKDSLTTSSPKIAAPVVAAPTVPFIANIQDSIEDIKNVKTVETSPLLPAQPVHVNVNSTTNGKPVKESKSNAHIISLTRYVISMILISIVIVSLWFLSGITFPWFIFPLFLLAILFQIRFFQIRSGHLDDHDKSINWLLLHTCMSLSFFATSLVSWAYLYPLWSYPWILYVLAFQFWLLVIHIGRVQFKWNYLIVHMWTYLTASCMLILTWYLTKLYIKEYVLGIAIYGTLLILGMAARKVYYLTKTPEKTSDLQSVIVVENEPRVIDKNQEGLYQIVAVGSQDYTSFPTLSKPTSSTSFSAKYEHLKGKMPRVRV